jgi:hypothetical protein
MYTIETKTFRTFPYIRRTKQTIGNRILKRKKSLEKTTGWRWDERKAKWYRLPVSFSGGDHTSKPYIDPFTKRIY